MNLKEIKTLLSKSKHPEDIFGYDISRSEAVKIFKRFKSLTHEDKVPDIDKSLAHDLFIEINKLWDIALFKFRNETYGDVSVDHIDKFSIKSKYKSYDICGSFSKGSLCNVYHTTNHILKVSKTHTDNSLLEQEAKVLNLFKNSSYEILHKTVPTIFESFDIRNKGKEKLNVNVLDYYDGYVSLSRILEVYPDGIDGRHIIWIWKRILMTLGFVHKHKIVHGCLNLDNILINPVEHSLIIIDWCYSVSEGESLVLIDSKYKDYYPGEVFKKESVNSDLDIYMSAKCMQAIFDKMSPHIYQLIRSALIQNKSSRYKNAWDVYDIIVDCADKIYGKSKFIELNL
jgi:serine/threonine protein kinase